MVSTHLIFYACLELRFPDVEPNPGTRRPVPGVCRILCCNMGVMSLRNLSDLTVASSQYDLLLCSDGRHISELLVPVFGRLALACRNGLLRASGMAAYVRDEYGIFRQPKLECGCWRCWYLGCVVLDRTSMCSACIQL